MKYYTVWVGRKIGVFDNWKDCEESIKNFPSAKYKSFESLEEAKLALLQNLEKFFNQKKKFLFKQINDQSTELPEKESICVDASCSGNPGIMIYRGVDTWTGKEIFKSEIFENATNCIGEFLAIAHALRITQEQKLHTTTIYSDSNTAIKWILNKKCNSKFLLSNENKKLLELIHKTERWLQNNNWTNKIIKWDTEKWGEIPADFGKK